MTRCRRSCGIDQSRLRVVVAGASARRVPYVSPGVQVTRSTQRAWRTRLERKGVKDQELHAGHTLF